MPSGTLISLAEPLQACTTRAEVRDRMIELSSSLGFNYFSVVNRKISDPSAVTTTIEHNYSPEWEDLYRIQRFFSKDPANSSIILKQPFLKWSEIPKSEVFKAAAEYDISNGITCATRSARHICSVSFSTSAKGISDEMVIAVRFIASYVADIFAKINEAEDFCPETVGLSQREQECLRWVCAGKSSWDISRILSISERTVLFHLTNIQKKLHTTTRSHSAAKSVLLGLLDQELFFRSDPFSVPFSSRRGNLPMPTIETRTTNLVVDETPTPAQCAGVGVLTGVAIRNEPNMQSHREAPQEKHVRQSRHG